MSYSKKIKAFKIVIFIITILLLVGLTLYLFPIISKLFSVEGREAFKQEMEQSGTMGMFMLLGLQASQIFLPILPGEPIEILAGMCYGTVGGFIFITFSVLITTTIIFFLVRKFGRDFVYSICSKERIEKIENSKLFKNPKKARIHYAYIVSNSWNTKRYISIFSRFASNKATKIYSNLNICEISICNFFYYCWFKFSRRKLAI